MNTKDEVTTVVEVLDIQPGEPPKITTGERLCSPGKQGRMFVQTVAVPDAALFARLAEQVAKGDTIEATVTTEWFDDGYTTYLSDFALQHKSNLASTEKAALAS